MSLNVPKPCLQIGKETPCISTGGDYTTLSLPFSTPFYLSSVWILIAQSVMVSGFWLDSQWWYLIFFMFLWGLCVMIGHAQLSLLILGEPHWGIDNYRLIIYLSDWLPVYMCQDDTCGIISQSDHKSYDQKSKCSRLYVYHWMRHIGFCENLSSLQHGIRLRNTLHSGVVASPVQVRTVKV